MPVSLLDFDLPPSSAAGLLPVDDDSSLQADALGRIHREISDHMAKQENPSSDDRLSGLIDV